MKLYLSSLHKSVHITSQNSFKCPKNYLWYENITCGMASGATDALGFTTRGCIKLYKVGQSWTKLYKVGQRCTKLHNVTRNCKKYFLVRILSSSPPVLVGLESQLNMPSPYSPDGPPVQKITSLPNLCPPLSPTFS